MTMTAEQRGIIEGAYWAGFEPSSDGLTAEALLAEAGQFLFNSITFTN